MTRKYIEIYSYLRDEILKGVYSFGDRLPSKRQICDDYGVSVITVEHSMELLEQEGYIEPKERSGYFVSYREGDSFSVAPFKEDIHNHDIISASDLSSGFPFGVYSKTVRRILSERGAGIMSRSPNKGVKELRDSISEYLARNRNLFVSPEQIIIGSGAEYLYGLVVQILGRNLIYGIEKPSYEKIEKVYRANDVKCRFLSLGQDGILSNELSKTDADVLHITPYRSYPSGITASAAKRREYIRWAEHKDGRYIVEDDFESEFTPSAKPQETVFSLCEKGNSIYINTFSKTIAPSVRMGYMVLPENLNEEFENRVGFYSCPVPTLDQYVLAEFINSGDFERHINRVRRKAKK